MSFKDISGQAILVGENIRIINSENDVKSMIAEGEIVHLMGVSDSLFQDTDDYCDAYRLVKTDIKSDVKLIDGRHVYQIISSDQDTSFQYQDVEYDLKSTAFFGIGVSDENGLTFCDKYFEPVVLINKGSKRPKLIELVENNFSSDASLKTGFKYLQLMSNDQAYDKIEKIEQLENGVVFTIKRDFQEGWNRFQIRLTINGDHCKAEYVNYGDVQN